MLLVLRVLTTVTATPGLAIFARLVQDVLLRLAFTIMTAPLITPLVLERVLMLFVKGVTLSLPKVLLIVGHGLVACAPTVDPLQELALSLHVTTPTLVVLDSPCVKMQGK